MVVSETDVSGRRSRPGTRQTPRVEAASWPGSSSRLERFARDMIEGCIALKRIWRRGGRFCPMTESTPPSPPRIEFFPDADALAESYSRKVTERFSERVGSISKGIHAGSIPPFDTTGRRRSSTSETGARSSRRTGRSSARLTPGPHGRVRGVRSGGRTTASRRARERAGSASRLSRSFVPRCRTDVSRRGLLRRCEAELLSRRTRTRRSCLSSASSASNPGLERKP